MPPLLAPLFSSVARIDIPTTLFERTLAAIQRARELQARNRLWVAIVSCALSLTYAIFNWSAWIEELKASSFVELIRLTISDPDIMLSHLKDVFLGLLETLPLGSMLLGLSILFLIVAVIALAHSWQHLKQSPRLTLT